MKIIPQDKILIKLIKQYKECLPNCKIDIDQNLFLLCTENETLTELFSFIKKIEKEYEIYFFLKECYNITLRHIKKKIDENNFK